MLFRSAKTIYLRKDAGKGSGKEMVLTDEELTGNFQGNVCGGLNALKEKVLECSECSSAFPKNGGRIL